MGNKRGLGGWRAEPAVLRTAGAKPAASTKAGATAAAVRKNRIPSLRRQPERDAPALALGPVHPLGGAFDP